MLDIPTKGYSYPAVSMNNSEFSFAGSLFLRPQCLIYVFAFEAASISATSDGMDKQ